MSKTIFLRVGNTNDVTLPQLVSSLQNFLRLLQDFDASISRKSGGSLKWEVTVLQKQSPAVIGVTPTPKPRMDDISEAVEAQVFTGYNELSERGQRTQYMSDSALQAIENISKFAKKIGPSSIYVAANGQPKQEAVLTTETFRRVKELTDVRYVAFGSIIGKLEAISVHRSNEFRVWDEKTGKPVRCMFHADLEKDVTKLLRETVLVTGTINSNSAGSPVSVDVRDVGKRLAGDNLPTIDEMRGLVKDFTGGRSLKEYFEEIADE